MSEMTHTENIILMQSDDNYAPFMGVAMTSLFENNKEESYDIAIVDNDLNSDNKGRLTELCSRYKRNIVFIPVTDTIAFLEESQVPKLRGSYSTYLKLFVMEKLKDYKRAIYLDADIVIGGSIAELLSLDMGENLFAMALDVEPVIRKLQYISEPEFWYNAGVMIFNVPQYLAEDCQQQVVDFVKTNKLTLYFHEQDIVNVLFRKRILKINNRFNFMTIYQHLGFENSAYVYDWSDSILEAMKSAAANPVVYHCFLIMGRRPWHKGYAMESTVQFDKYLALSTYADYEKKEPNLSTVNRLQALCYKLLPKALYARLYKVLYMRQMRATFTENRLV